MSNPRRIGESLGALRQAIAPQTMLAAVQSAWSATAGEAIAAEAEPVSERDGVVTVACRSATWAQELDLIGPQLLERLRQRPEAGRLRERARGAAIHRRRGPPRRALIQSRSLFHFSA